MTAPHDIAFPYRPYILVLILAGAAGVALIDPGSDRADRLPDTLSIGIVAALGYGTTRAFAWLAVRSLGNSWPRLVRASGLIWFYGAIPSLLLTLYVGSIVLDARTPTPATVAFVVAAAASMAAGAFAAVQATAGRLTSDWSGP